MNPWKRARIYKDALLAIGTECETFARGSCSEHWVGRRRDGVWCVACIARVAIEEAS